MRSNVYILGISIVLLLSIALNIFLFKSLDKVQKQFDDQTKIIKKYDEIDKRLKKGDTDFINMLEKFMNGDAFTVEGKSVSTADFLLYNQRKVDSLNKYRRFYNYTKDNYGVNLKLNYNKDSTSSSVSSIGESKADSAMLLLEVYRKKLKRINKDTWTIDGDYEESYHNLLKRFNAERTGNKEVKEKVDSIIKQINSEMKNNKTN